MKILNKYILNLFILLLTLFSLKANSSNLNKDSAFHKVRLQLKWKHQFQFAGYYAAIEKGFYKDAGLKVELFEAEEGEEPANALFTNKADFAIAASDVVMLRSKGKPAVVLASIFQHSPQIIIASKKSGILHVHDLVGKKIMLESHAAEIIGFLKDENVTLNQLKIIYHNFDVNQLINGEVDAITAYITDEPFVLQRLNFDYTTISPLTGGIDFYGDVLITSENMIKESPAIVEKFLAATIKGWKYAMDNTEEMIELIVNKYSKRHDKGHLEYEASQMKRLIMPNVVEIGYCNPGRWENILATYKKLGFVDNSMTTKGLLYADYLKPQIYIPWTLIGIFSAGVTFIAFIAFFYFFLSKKLKTEILQRKKIEEELRQSSENFQNIFNAAPFPISVVSIENGKIFNANKNTIDLYELPVEKLSEISAFDLIIHDDDKNKIAQLLQNNGEINNYEIQVKSHHGIELWVTFSTRKVTINKKEYWINAQHNITERKKTEAALILSENKIRTIFESANTGIAITDSNGKYIIANSWWLNHLGYTKEEIFQKTNFDITHPDHLELSKYWFNKLKSNEVDKYRFEKKYVRKNGTFFWGDLVVTSIKDENNEYDMIIGFINDITERKLAEEKLKSSEQELRILNATKDKFFSIIAHDLKTPFTTILGFSELLQKKAKEINDKELENYVENLSISGKNAFKLLENLLDWSRLQMGKFEFKPALIDLDDLIDDAISLVKNLAENKHITIQYISFKSFQIWADRNMLFTIFRNLLSNAIKFTHQMGNINILVEESELFIEISVIDTGIGMDSNLIDKLFKINEKVTQPGTEKEIGTGLGLLLCKEFIDKHKGNIKVDSIPEKGSTFKFSLPKYFEHVS